MTDFQKGLDPVQPRLTVPWSRLACHTPCCSPRRRSGGPALRLTSTSPQTASVVTSPLTCGPVVTSDISVTRTASVVTSQPTCGPVVTSDISVTRTASVVTSQPTCGPVVTSDINVTSDSISSDVTADVWACGDVRHQRHLGQHQ